MLIVGLLLIAMNLINFETEIHQKERNPNMKKALIAFSMVAMLVLSACGGGKPNMDDPKAIAKFNCEKMTEMMDYLKDPVANTSKIDAISKEMEDFEKAFNEHHGDKAEAMEKQIQTAMKEVCPDLAGAF